MNNLSDEINKLPRKQCTDTFNFQCMQCGNCCHTHDDQYLTGVDIFRMAIALQEKPRTIVEKYCRVIVQKDAGRPALLLEYAGNGTCPLMIDNKCIVHSNKPISCAVYPLAYSVNFKNRTIEYVDQSDLTCTDENKSKIECQGKYSDNSTVQEWIEQANIQKDYNSLYTWYNTLVKIFTHPFTQLHISQKYKYDEPEAREFINLLLDTLFYNFEINQSYDFQIKKNWKTTKKILNKKCIDLGMPEDYVNNFSKMFEVVSNEVDGDSSISEVSEIINGVIKDKKIKKRK